ncbi:REST corepressor 1-like isoform X2 [Apostichopus japonicus]|uniref:REST corepressor 1-like isoform X2 n=1 Tax=Stichopus japonicus TaxID=307972 RepID=UPI003AB3D1CC
MVVVDKNNGSEQNHRSNGTASGANSSNGRPSEESGSSSDEESEPGMRIGSEYQAEIPEVQIDVPLLKRGDNRPEALLVWSPSAHILDAKLDEYISLAKDKYGYSAEQALGMLFWHKHNVEKSLADLPNFTPFPDEWTVEDRVLFEQAFSFHGKSFHRIRQMLPDKSISSLVKYYYQWKKNRTRTSLMDRQAKKLASGGKEEGETEQAMDTTENPPKEGEAAVEKSAVAASDPASKGACNNCAASVSQLHTTPKGSLCNPCYSYWRRTGVMRQHVGPVKNESQSNRHHPGGKMPKKPPKGMYIDKEDLLTVSNNQGDAVFKALDNDIVNAKRQIQYNKQWLAYQQDKVTSIEAMQPPELNQKNSSRWTNEEQLIAVQAIRKYGRNHQAIADVVGNKTVLQCRSFMMNFRRRFNLDKVLEEYEAEQVSLYKEKAKTEDVGGTPPLTSHSHASLASGATPPPLKPSNPVPSQKPSIIPPQSRLMQPKVSMQKQPPPLIRPGGTTALTIPQPPGVAGPLSRPPVVTVPLTVPVVPSPMVVTTSTDKQPLSASNS